MSEIRNVAFAVCCSMIKASQGKLLLKYPEQVGEKYKAIKSKMLKRWPELLNTQETEESTR